MAKAVFHPLTKDRWKDLSALFGSKGACGGCWCMTSRRTRKEYDQGKGAGNRRAFQRIVAADRQPGVLGYVGDEPVAWCSVEPRERFEGLKTSRILAPVDDTPVWSISCLFIHREHRGAGLSVAAIEAAVAHARRRGARWVEAYPVEPKTSPMPPVFAYTGIASAYRSAGFKEVARRSETRPIMRRAVRPPR